VTLALYGHPFSSYTWKAQIALYANETPFEFRMLDPDHPENAMFVGEAHPAGKFPVLTDNGLVVVETTAIIEYLAVHYPGPAPLIPIDPGMAASARMLDRVFDSYVMGNMQRVVAAYFADRDNPGGAGLRDNPDPAEIEAGKRGLRRAYRWLENWLSANVLTPHVSLVSCAAAPSLFYADWVEPIPEDCPRLAELRGELLALPAVSRCVEEARPYRAWFPPGAPDRD
jgi:glutathione S-transferase